MVVYSWRTSLISTSTTAEPGIEESSTRRNALPRVCPKPRSRGSIFIFALLPPSARTSTRRGFNSSVKWDCIKATPGCGLLGVQLHNQLFVYVRRQITALGHGLENPAHLLRVHVHPFRKPALLGEVQGGQIGRASCRERV